jgi:PAS domain S-box-containing protein
MPCDEAGIVPLAAIVDSSEEVIVSPALDGMIATWNRAAESMYGYPAAEAMSKKGRPFSLH